MSSWRGVLREVISKIKEGSLPPSCQAFVTAPRPFADAKNPKHIWRNHGLKIALSVVDEKIARHIDLMAALKVSPQHSYGIN